MVTSLLLSCCRWSPTRQFLCQVIMVMLVLSLSAAGASRRSTEPHFHLDLERTEPVSSSSSPKPPSAHGSRSHSATPERRASPLPGFSESLGGSLEDDLAGIRKRARGDRLSDDLNSSPRPGLQKYLSRFDDAMKLRGQLANEKPVQDRGADSDEFDPFVVFRLVGSVLLAVFVRLFVCKYLVRPGSLHSLWHWPIALFLPGKLVTAGRKCFGDDKLSYRYI